MVPSTCNACASQAELRAEAEGLVRQLGLLEALSRYGRAGLVGSVPLELIVKLDVDIHVVVPQDADPLDVGAGISRMVLDGGRVRQVRISDYRATHAAVKLGLDRVPSQSGDWSIDVWITSRPEAAGFAELLRLQASLTKEQRETILALKRHYYALGLLSGGLSSQIYAAVCDHGVKTPDDFKSWAAARHQDRPTTDWAPEARGDTPSGS